MIIRVFKRFIPVVPGAIVAVVLLTAISALTDAHAHGVAVVGAVQGGFPPIGLPSGISWSDVPKVLPTALSCFVLIIAQSAATSRSFAFKHGDAVDINRDIVGLSGANLAAGLSGTFVVNGSPTKTQILDEQKGRTQLANLTMAAVVLLFTLFFTGLLADMPTAVLAGIVFLIGVSLIDLPGLKRLWQAPQGRVRGGSHHDGHRLRRRRRAGNHPRRRALAARPRPAAVQTGRLRHRSGPGRRTDLPAGSARARRACPGSWSSATTRISSTPTPTASPTTSSR